MPEISESKKAEIVMLGALNYTGTEISEELGVGETTVHRHLRHFEEKAKAADDWERVFWEAVLPAVFDKRFQSDIAAGLIEQA